jgi:hypothetical protein
METNEEKEYTRARSNVSPKLLLDGKAESRWRSFLHLRMHLLHLLQLFPLILDEETCKAIPLSLNLSHMYLRKVT